MRRAGAARTAAHFRPQNSPKSGSKGGAPPQQSIFSWTGANEKGVSVYCSCLRVLLLMWAPVRKHNCSKLPAAASTLVECCLPQESHTWDSSCVTCCLLTNNHRATWALAQRSAARYKAPRARSCAQSTTSGSGRSVYLSRVLSCAMRAFALAAAVSLIKNSCLCWAVAGVGERLRGPRSDASAIST